ncbi:MAG: WG repeat-containing protein [Bacteroidota bacterium]
MKHRANKRTNMIYKSIFLFLAIFIFSKTSTCQIYPIFQDGKFGFISKNGKIVAEPIQMVKLGPIDGHPNTENLIDFIIDGFNSRRNHQKDFLKNHFLTLSKDKESFILKNTDGKNIDKCSLSEDTLKMYFYLNDNFQINQSVNSKIWDIRGYFDLEEKLYLQEKGMFLHQPIKYGLKSNTGKVIIQPEVLVKGLNKIFHGTFKSLNHKLFFSQDKIYNKDGEEIIQVDSYKIFSVDLLQIERGGMYGLLKSNGQVLIPYQNKEIKYFSDDKVILSEEGGPDQIVNFSGDTLLQAERINAIRTSSTRTDGYHGVVPIYSYNIAVVETSTKNSVYGYINDDAEWIIQPKQYAPKQVLQVYLRSHDLIKLEEHNYHDRENMIIKQGVINKSGEKLIELNENIDVGILSDGWVRIIELDNDSLSYLKNVYSEEKVNLEGSQTSTRVFKCSGETFILVYEEEVLTSRGAYKNAYLYSVKGERLNKIDDNFEIVNLNLSDRQNVIIVKKEDSYFLFDPVNEGIVSQGFEYLSFGSITFPTEKNKLFIAEHEGKKGVINEKGEWIIQPVYIKIGPFYGDLALAQKEPRSFQYINRVGETVWKLPEDDKLAWNEEHFLESYKNCTPLIFRQKVGRQKVVIQYEIKGSSGKGKGCKVESKYLENPNPDWINKSMTCTYDNSLPFREAYEKSLPNNSGENPCDCEGELWDIMSKKK